MQKYKIAFFHGIPTDSVSCFVEKRKAHGANGLLRAVANGSCCWLCVEPRWSATTSAAAAATTKSSK
jgi:hypothetical protein